MDAQPDRASSNWWRYPVAVVAILAPLVIIWKIDVAMASGEYAINAWLVAYNGEYFRHHGSFPASYHTSYEVGSAMPVFYGYVLFKIAGVLSLIGGPHLALRILIVFSFAVVYLCVRYAMRKFGTTEALATATACAVCWATYPLTNLYNRGAFAEFFAASWLTASCCCWLVFFLHPRRTTNVGLALLAGLLLVLAVGTHPITGMLSVPFLVIIYFLQWGVPVAERPSFVRRHGAFLLSAILGTVVLAPWLYAYHTTGKELAISQSFVPALGYFNGGNWTGAVIRLSPIPVDYQNINHDSPRLGVPHLDTQINVSLLLISLILFASVARRLSWRNRARLAAILTPLVLLGLAAFIISVYRTGFEGATMQYPKFPSFLWKVQYAYRLVAVVNLAILLVLLVSLAYRRVTHAAGGTPRLCLAPFALGIIVTLSATGMLVKLVHGKASIAPHQLPLRSSKPNYEKWLLNDPSLPTHDYVSSKHHKLLQPHGDHLVTHRFPIGTGSDFGQPTPVRVVMLRDGFVGTQAQPFRWTTLRVDGRVVPPEQLAIWHDLKPNQRPTMDTRRLAVPVPAGEHVVEYAFTPPLVWTYLDRISQIVLAAWCGATIVVLAWGWLPRRRARTLTTAEAPKELPAPPQPLAAAA